MNTALTFNEVREACKRATAHELSPRKLGMKVTTDLITMEEFIEYARLLKDYDAEHAPVWKDTELVYRHNYPLVCKCYEYIFKQAEVKQVATKYAHINNLVDARAELNKQDDRINNLNKTIVQYNKKVAEQAKDINILQAKYDKVEERLSNEIVVYKFMSAIIEDLASRDTTVYAEQPEPKIVPMHTYKVHYVYNVFNEETGNSHEGEYDLYVEATNLKQARKLAKEKATHKDTMISTTVRKATKAELTKLSK